MVADVKVSGGIFNVIHAKGGFEVRFLDEVVELTSQLPFPVILALKLAVPERISM